ncbi:rhodanese-like domain-containing protein [Halovivax sp.]|uniref:rhodanese-like domain-containing protein n=1 Tax=Halovivax sp. TaxID=1935978 RepID=UPI0025C70E0F|nr:rhodanese-like domain-containing protein [Halovivax sp.]
MREPGHRGPSGPQRARYGHGVYPGYDELVRAAEATVRRYSPAEAIDVAGEPGVLFVDVRDAVELLEGVISGATHASRGRLEAHLDPNNSRYVSELDDAAEIVFYCASGARSALAARRAQELGYDRVRYLDGGITAWTDAGGQRQVISNSR